MPPNQQFKLTVASRVQLTWLSIGLVQMIKLSLWDSFRWLHYENYLPAVVPTARRQVSAASRFIGSRSVRAREK